MHIIVVIVLALAFAIADMLLFYRCASIVSVRLTRGLLQSALVAAFGSICLLLGCLLGNLLRFEGNASADAFSLQNGLVSLGMMLFVAVRMFLPYLRKEPKLPVFDLSSWSSVAAMGLASAVNLLIVGLALGFAWADLPSVHILLWPLFALCFLLGYLGIMFGRGGVAVRPRRWMAVASMAMVGVAVTIIIASR